MFCQKCGCILTEGARFCGNCGAEISPATATPQEQTAAQVVTNNAPQGAQPQPTRAEALMNEYHRAANAQSGIPQDIQPERYTVPDPVPEKKKRSKLVPGICIAAGALVVLGGAGALVYNLNKPAVTRMIMGDANYAHSVMMNAITGADNAAFEAASQQALNMAASAMSSGAASQAGDIVQNAANGELGALDSVVTGSDPMEQAGTALRFAADYANRMTGMDGVSITFSGGAEFDQAAIDRAIAEADAEEYRDKMTDFMKSLGSIEFTAAEKNSGGAYEYSARLTSGGDTLGELQTRYGQDGRTTVIFPGMSTTGFQLTLPAHTEAQEIPQYDVTKFYGNLAAGFREQFRNYEITCVDGSEQLGTLKFTGMTVQIKLDKDDICDLLQLVIDTAQNDEELGSYIKALAQISDEELADAYKEMSESVATARGNSVKAAAELTFFVNKSNTPVGIKAVFTANDDVSETMEWLTDGQNSEFIAQTSDNELYIAAHTTGTSADSGNMVIEMNPAMLHGSLGTFMEYADNNRTAVFNVEYSGVGTANVFGMPFTVGTYKLTFPDDTAKLLSDGDAETEKALSNSAFTLDSRAQGKGISYNLCAELSGYGKFTLGMKIDEAAGEVAPVPGSEYKLLDPDSMTEDESTAFQNDILSYYTELSKKNTLVSSIFDMATVLQEINSDYSDDYWDYPEDDGNDWSWTDESEWDQTDESDWSWTDESDGWSDSILPTPQLEATAENVQHANEVASLIKDMASEFLAKMEAEGAALLSDSNVVSIYSFDGNWSLYSYTMNDPSDWADGQDHWGFNFDPETLESTASGDSSKEMLAYFEQSFPELQNTFMAIYIENGKVIGAAYIPEGIYSELYAPELSDFENGTWDYCGEGAHPEIDGVINGWIIGLSPVLTRK